MSLTYATYLKVDELLELQVPQSDPVEHDELLFIVIHQAYELWFKLLLHELDRAKQLLSDNQLFDAIATFKRCRTVMKTLVGQIDILETMTPMQFFSFRDRLEAASGFQSYQFRELEFLLGYKRPEMLRHYADAPSQVGRLQRRLAEPSLVFHLYEFLGQRGVPVPPELLQRDPQLPTDANPTIQQGLLSLYRDQHDVGILLELLTDFDEGLQEWRYRHVKMVERTIGNQRGTGGSLGVEFLKASLFRPIFPDLWAIRQDL